MKSGAFAFCSQTLGQFSQRWISDAPPLKHAKMPHLPHAYEEIARVKVRNWDLGCGVCRTPQPNNLQYLIVKDHNRLCQVRK
jgi:hypothetical protein